MDHITDDPAPLGATDALLKEKNREVYFYTSQLPYHIYLVFTQTCVLAAQHHARDFSFTFDGSHLGGVAGLRHTPSTTFYVRQLLLCAAQSPLFDYSFTRQQAPVFYQHRGLIV